MNEERTPLEESQEPVLNPPEPPQEEFRTPSAAGLKVAVGLFTALAVFGVGYGWLQHNAVRELAEERGELSASLAKAKGQEDALTAKINQLNVAQAQAQAEAAQAQNHAPKNQQFPPRTREIARRPSHPRQASRPPADDPRWAKVQQQLSEQQKALAENQEQIAQAQSNLQDAKLEMDQNLQSARNDLNGGIARNHDELVALEKKGERNFYEFSFEKSKTYHHTGPISIALRKADEKHEYCDLQMIVDDQEITRKHVNLYESISFYPQGYLTPLEVVINHISKDAVQGYVSDPKYRPTVQAAAPAPAPPANPTAANAAAPSPDEKLVHREQAEQ